MKRICFFAGNMSASGGTERMTQLLGNAFAEDGDYEVFVLTKSDQGKPPFFPLNRKVTYSVLDNGKYYKIFTLIKDVFLLRRFLRKNKIDVLINVDVALGVFSLPQKILCPKVRQIFWEHFSVHYNGNNPRMTKLRKLALRLGDAYVTLTPQDAQVLRGEYDKCCKTVNVPNICTYAPSNIPYNSSSKTVLSVGALLNAKGFNLALDAAKKVFEKHPDWKWEIYGDGRERAALVKKAEDLGLQSFVQFMGRSQDLMPAYQNAAIYVLPSRSEGFGLVLLEAQANHLPTVAFDVPYGPRNIIENGVNGFLIPPFDVDLMAEKICQLMEDEELRVRFSNYADRDLPRYSAGQVVQSWKKLIGEL